MKIIMILIALFFSTAQVLSKENKIIETDIYKNLRCLVCQGQSVAESNSDFAQTIKVVIKDKINEGKSQNEIYDFLISKYGEWIVYKPRFNKNNLLLWLMPYFIFLLGGVIILNNLKKSNNKKDN
jgi:cytochrome c-type biogenesis protein CcmH|tara:strand:+ start:423 stop:797 length:375 start_codon:yes stop_codon:yes gene_type:complete